VLAMPEDVRDGEGGLLLYGRLREEVLHHALNLVDASRTNNKAGITIAVDAIIATVRKYQDAFKVEGANNDAS